METPNEFINNDLMEDILLRLPVRHLLQLRCVSKSWCALIDSTSFINKHHQVQSTISQEEGDAPLFLTSISLYRADFYSTISQDEGGALVILPSRLRYHTDSKFCLLSKKLGDNILRLTQDLVRDGEFSDAAQIHESRMSCKGVVNGVVCLHWAYVGHLGLWNPATRKFKFVPPPQRNDLKEMRLGVDIFGLGFDPKSNDFKIVRSTYFENIDYLCEMYSLSTNSWKRLKLPLSRHRRCQVNFATTDGYYNGAYYRTAVELDRNDLPQRYAILSFDFTTEAFKFFDAPPAVATAAANNLYNFHWMVGLYMERLALIFCRPEPLKNFFEIWVASRFDVGDGTEFSLSWQHLFTIEPLPESYIYAKNFVAFRMDGDVLFRGREDSILYNPSTRTFKNLGLSLDTGYRYVESLFPLSKRQIQSSKELNKLKKCKREQVLESFENKYDESEDFASPSQTQDDAYSTPTTSHITDDSFSGTHQL